MEQENRNQQNAAPQVSLGDQIKVRREKLAALRAAGSCGVSGFFSSSSIVWPPTVVLYIIHDTGEKGKQKYQAIEKAARRTRSPREFTLSRLP